MSGSRGWQMVGIPLTAAVLALSGASALTGTIRHEATTEFGLPASDGAQQVTTDNGRVTVRAAKPGERGVIRVHSRWTFGKPQVVVRGGAVSTRCPASALGGCRDDVEIVVPGDARVDLRTSNGDIAVTGLSGQVVAKTSNGDVIVRDSRASTLMLESSNGDIDVASRVAPTSLTALTSLGDVTVHVPPDGTAYAVDAHTSLGDVRNAIPNSANAAHRLVLRSSLGDVDVERG